MSGRRRLGFVAGAATLLAAAPLSTIFERWTWLVQSFIAVALVAGVAALTRSLRAPVWAQLLGMIGGLLLALTWLFPSGEEFLGVLPAPQTFAHFAGLMTQSVEDMRSYGVKVPDTHPLLFVTVLGVGAVAVVVDLLTVGLRRPALAGLPMLAIYSVPVAVYVDSVPAVPFVVGATGFLWLLVADNVDRVRRFGRRFTGDGRDVDVWEPSPLAAAGRRLAVVGVALAVLLPVAVPGMTTGLLQTVGSSGTGDGPGGGGTSGLGRVNLFAALSGQLRQSETTELVKVTTTEQDPFYLRFGVADEINQDGFRSRGPSGKTVSRGLPVPAETNRSGVTRERHHARVEVSANFDMQLLPTYADPVSTEHLDSSWFYDDTMQVIYSNRSRTKNKKYEFDYVRSQYTAGALRSAAPLPSGNPIRQQFTRVPPVREVQQLVAGLTKNTKTQYDGVRAIYDYFSRNNGFSYSLQTETGTSGRDIVDFLHHKIGFCQQYAAAMAWLVRAAGVPARVAFGFTNGSNRRDGTMTLTNLNLHAWTEVYFDGFGWVPFDATPAASVPGSTRSEWAPDTDAPDPISPSAAPSAGAGGDASVGPDGARRPEKDPSEVQGVDGGAITASGPTWPWWTLGAALLLLALLAVPALRRTLLRRRRQVLVTAAGMGGGAGVDGDALPGVPWVVVTGAEAERARRDAHAAWDELIDTLVDFRVLIDESETPRATADRLFTGGLVTGAAAEGMRLLSRAEERARYARDPVQGARLTEALRAVRRALSARADGRTRLLAATLPPSVLLRWRLGLMDGTARIVGAVSRWRAGFVRWSPRRLLAGRPSR